MHRQKSSQENRRTTSLSRCLQRCALTAPIIKPSLESLSNIFELVVLREKEQTRHQIDAKETQTGHEEEMGCVCNEQTVQVDKQLPVSRNEKR